MRTASEQRGSTVLETLVGMVIFITVSAGIVATFNNTARHAYDETQIGRANEQARLALDLFSYDLRMAGAGMPLGQGGFAPGGAGLGDSPLPVLTTATATFIVFRANTTGRVTVLATAFTPSAVNRTIDVLSASDLDVGNTIYLSNLTAGGTLGLKGVVESKFGNLVTLDSGYLTSAAASFATGSVVHRVTQLSYTSPLDNSGIVRDDEASNITIVPNSSFSLTYYDAAGNELAPPLTEAVIQNELCSIQVDVSVPAANPLRNGETFIATARDRVALRNLILSR